MYVDLACVRQHRHAVLTIDAEAERPLPRSGWQPGYCHLQRLAREDIDRQLAERRHLPLVRNTIEAKGEALRVSEAKI